MSVVFLPVADQAPGVQHIAAMPTLAPQSGLMYITGQPQVAPQMIITPPMPGFKPNSYSTAAKRNNEDVVYDVAGSVENGAKKIRIEPSNVSKVVHLRSLPSDVTDAEVIQLGMSYGKVTNIIMLKGKNQAFLEMEDENVAHQMVISSELHPPMIRQRIVYVQFSNHKELKTDNSPNQLKAQSVLHAMQQTEGGVNHVLHVMVDNMVYQVTVDTLHKIFLRFGSVLKIITFTKNNQFQALIQMGDAIQAQAAKVSLDGQNVFSSCCTLRIEYSKLTSLNVKFNNDKCRDFTKPELTMADSTLFAQPALHNVLTNAGGFLASPYAIQPAIPPASIQQPQFTPMTAPATGALGANVLQPSLAPYPAQIVATQSSVLHVSNLNEEMITPQALFILFGVYGDVIRVKILYQKMSNALVQMADYTQAQLVMTYLQGVTLFGQPLQITLSRHNQVQMPKEGLEMAKLTQDYSNSPLHRFKKPGSKNYQNIFPPSEVLHLSNIPPEVSEDFIKSTFSKEGQVQAFKFFAKDKKMALIKLSSVEEAIKCLVNFHNFKLSETNHLRVSFSKGHI